MNFSEIYCVLRYTTFSTFFAAFVATNTVYQADKRFTCPSRFKQLGRGGNKNIERKYESLEVRGKYLTQQRN